MRAEGVQAVRAVACGEFHRREPRRTAEESLGKLVNIPVHAIIWSTRKWRSKPT
jgi:hypothetical protein